MTIGSTTNQIPYTGDGVSTVFAYPSPFITTADIKVLIAGVLQSTGYTVSGTADVTGNGAFVSGTVTFVSPPANGAAVILYCDPDQLQSTTLLPNDPLPAKAVEKMVDKVTLLIQRVKQSIAQGIFAPLGETLSILPAAALRANLLLGFDSSGNPVAVAPSSGSALALATNLATANDLTKGAGQIGYGKAIAYPANTPGGVLNGQGSAANLRSDLLLAGNGPSANQAAGDTQHQFEIVNDNTTYQCFGMYAYGAATNGNNVHYNRYRGTLAAPTAVQNSDYFMSCGYRGWDGTGTLSQSYGAFQYQASENWDSTHHGGRFKFELAKAGGGAGGISRFPAWKLYAGAADGAVMELGDETALASRILNASTTGFLQLHGSQDQTGAQLALYGVGHATLPNNVVVRGDLVSIQDRSGNEVANFNLTTKQLLISGNGGFGYTNGAGATAAQVSTKGDGITANAPTVQITMNAAALAGNTAVSFTWTSSKIGANDHILVNIVGGVGGGAYNAWSDLRTTGSARIVLKNITGGSLSDAVVLQVSVLKGAAS